MQTVKILAIQNDNTVKVHLVNESKQFEEFIPFDYFGFQMRPQTKEYVDKPTDFVFNDQYVVFYHFNVHTGVFTLYSCTTAYIMAYLSYDDNKRKRSFRSSVELEHEDLLQLFSQTTDERSYNKKLVFKVKDIDPNSIRCRIEGFIFAAVGTIKTFAVDLRKKWLECNEVEYAYSNKMKTIHGTDLLIQYPLDPYEYSSTERKYLLRGSLHMFDTRIRQMINPTGETESYELQYLGTSADEMYFYAKNRLFAMNIFRNNVANHLVRFDNQIRTVFIYLGYVVCTTLRNRLEVFSMESSTLVLTYMFDPNEEYVDFINTGGIVITHTRNSIQGNDYKLKFYALRDLIKSGAAGPVQSCLTYDVAALLLGKNPNNVIDAQSVRLRVVIMNKSLGKVGLNHFAVSVTGRIDYRRNNVVNNEANNVVNNVVNNEVNNVIVNVNLLISPDDRSDVMLNEKVIVKETSETFSGFLKLIWTDANGSEIYASTISQNGQGTNFVTISKTQEIKHLQLAYWCVSICVHANYLYTVNPIDKGTIIRRYPLRDTLENTMKCKAIKISMPFANCRIFPACGRLFVFTETSLLYEIDNDLRVRTIYATTIAPKKKQDALPQSTRTSVSSAFKPPFEKTRIGDYFEFGGNLYIICAPLEGKIHIVRFNPNDTVSKFIFTPQFQTQVSNILFEGNWAFFDADKSLTSVSKLGNGIEEYSKPRETNVSIFKINMDFEGNNLSIANGGLVYVGDMNKIKWSELTKWSPAESM